MYTNISDIFYDENTQEQKIVTDANNFYLGIAAENYLKSMLQRSQYDIIQSHIDYGIDFVAIKRKDYIIDNKVSPLYFQVKSKEITLNLNRKISNQYITDITDISISSSTLTLMEKYKANFGLFVFFYLRHEKSATSKLITDSFEYDYLPFLYCWLDINDILKLNKLSRDTKKTKDKKISGSYYIIYFKIKIPSDKNTGGKQYIKLSSSKRFTDEYDILNDKNQDNHYKLKGFIDHNTTR